MYSLELNRLVAFPPVQPGQQPLPAWSADGSKIAFSSARTGDPEIWVADASGGNLHRATTFRGPDVAPTWNPRTNAQIAWVSGRTGLPQIYTMDQDGTGVQRMTDGGYAVSPSWSPNGQLLAFSWNRKYGPGDPGGVDIHVIDIASKKYLQLTHESGSNDYPSGRRMGVTLSLSGPSGKKPNLDHAGRWNEQHQLTTTGNNFMPNWSWK